MSQENVEVVRAAHERFNVGDIDGFLELCAPDIEFRDLPSLPGSGVFIGHDAMRAWWAQLYDAFDDLRFDPKDFLDAGERVVVVYHASARGKGSGALVEMSFSNVWTLSDRAIIRVVSYADHADALEAAGLRDGSR